jgi:hypothetical protein
LENGLILVGIDILGIAGILGTLGMPGILGKLTVGIDTLGMSTVGSFDGR